MAALLTLAIETSNPASSPTGDAQSVALGLVVARGGGVAPANPEPPALLVEEPVAPSSRERDDLMPAIDRLFRRANRDRRDLQAVAVSVGPGGFTALRVAVATAKMLALGAGARRGDGIAPAPLPVLAVPSALVAAWPHLCPGAATRLPLAVALASKGDGAFVTHFVVGAAGVGAVPLPDGRVQTAAELFSAGPPPATLIADAHAPEPFVTLARAHGADVLPPAFSAAACLAAAASIAPIDARALAPIYGREPEAVTLWRARHGSPTPPGGDAR